MSHTPLLRALKPRAPLTRSASLGRVFYRCALCFACLPSVVHGQILNPQPIVNQVENITEQVRQVTERIEQHAREQLDSVEASRLPRDLNGVITPVASTVVSTVLDLPEQLPIVNRTGTTAFVDVAVEGGWRAVDKQWLVMLEADELASLQQPGIEILEQLYLDDLDLTLLRFNVSDALNSREALREILPEALVDRLDRNHIYNPQNAAASTSSATAIANSTTSLCDNKIRIGMVDTAIQKDHPAFAASQIVEKNFLDNDFDFPDAHGTAVAGLLVGSNENTPARLPHATLYNASVFYSRNQFSQGATMMHLLKGINWLGQADVSVINMSLTGPDNRILASVIAKIISQGKVIVAAAGNAGPAAPPVFPAAYPNVIAATAVDDQQHIYRWANQGDFIDFAAPGVSVLTARSGSIFGRETGTSMAAPVVTAFVACELAKQPGNVTQIIERLANKAKDLGEPGRDTVFGYGLLK